MVDGGEKFIPAVVSGELTTEQQSQNGVHSAVDNVTYNMGHLSTGNMSVPRSMVNNNSVDDDIIDSLANLAEGFHISPTNLSPTADPYQVYQRRGSSIVSGSSGVSRSVSSYQYHVQSGLIGSPTQYGHFQNPYTSNPSQMYGASFTQTTFPNPYSYHQSLSPQHNGTVWPPSAQQRSDVSTDAYDDLAHRSLAGAQALPRQADHTHTRLGSTQSDLIPEGSELAQGHAQPQIYHNIVANGSHAVATLHAPPGPNAQNNNRPRRTRHRARRSSGAGVYQMIYFPFCEKVLYIRNVSNKLLEIPPALSLSQWLAGMGIKGQAKDGIIKVPWMEFSMVQ